MMLAERRQTGKTDLDTETMTMRIYVGNMAFSTTEDSLEALFSNYGEVSEVAVISDRETGRPRGFAFVTMPNDEEGKQAISALDGEEFEGRTLRINEAQPRAGGGGGGFRGGGGGGGGFRGGGGGGGGFRGGGGGGGGRRGGGGGGGDRW
ncbi:MAG: RNA-binding protein [Planctomycetota bacterium]